MPRKKLHASGSFGSRYGGNVRKRYTKIHSELKSKHLCPRCESPTLKRTSVGIWSCKKCGLTIAGGAYTPSTKIGQVSKRPINEIH
jgi:large subunit ribosomal protein L37Ae